MVPRRRTCAGTKLSGGPSVLATRRTSSVGPRSQRTIRAVGGSIATGHGITAAGGLGQVQRDRMLRALHPAAAFQRVLAQGAGSLCVTHPG